MVKRMKASKTEKAAKNENTEEKTVIYVSESGFDSTYSAMTKLLRNRPSQKQIEQFMKANPGVIVYVPKDRLQEITKGSVEHKESQFLRKLFEGAILTSQKTKGKKKGKN